MYRFTTKLALPLLRRLWFPTFVDVMLWTMTHPTRRGLPQWHCGLKALFLCWSPNIWLSSCTFKDAINAKQGSKILQPYKDEEPRDVLAWSKDHLRTQWKADVLQRSRSQEGILSTPCHIHVSTALSTFILWLSELAAANPGSLLGVQIISSPSLSSEAAAKVFRWLPDRQEFENHLLTLESTLTHKFSHWLPHWVIFLELDSTHCQG